jgi:protein-tyrosine sulfotransferase
VLHVIDPLKFSFFIFCFQESVIKNKEKIYKYDRQIPMIFIGGMPRSGTTLMRAMLDAHPMVRCGEETRVVPRILQMVAQWRKSPKESVRLREAGLTADVIDAGVSAFILEVVARHGEPAPRLCNKDPFTLKSGAYLASMFPNSKFIFMIRDARATVHSIISRKVRSSTFSLLSFLFLNFSYNIPAHICITSSGRTMLISYLKDSRALKSYENNIETAYAPIGTKVN